MVDKVVKYLQDWLVRYVKNKDLILRKLENVQETEGNVVVKYRGEDDQTFIIAPFIHDTDFSAIENELKEGRKALVLINTSENLDKIADEWSKLIKNRQLSIYFVNPFSMLDKKWVIFPSTHHNIAEEKKLKTGLLALFANVEAITEEKMRKIVESEDKI